MATAISVDKYFNPLNPCIPEWNDCYNERESLKHTISTAIVRSSFEVTPTIIANIKFQTSEGLHLKSCDGVLIEACKIYKLTNRLKLPECQHITWLICIHFTRETTTKKN